MPSQDRFTRDSKSSSHATVWHTTSQKHEKYGKYIERCIQIAYLDQFLLQDLLYREVEQANQPQDQKQRDSGVMFLKSLTTTLFFGALVVMTFNTTAVRDKKALTAQVKSSQVKSIFI